MFKRVVQLQKVYETVNQYLSNNFQMDSLTQFFVTKDYKKILIKTWLGDSDAMLLQLILFYGFGNWELMLEDKTNWNKNNP